MSVLPDHQIEDLVYKKGLIAPYLAGNLQPASYDVRLDEVIRVPHRNSLKSIDVADPESMRERTELYSMRDNGNGFSLGPGRFVLGATMEYVAIPNDLVGRIEGKSSVARLGLQIHCAGYLDPGFRGNVTVELVNFFDVPIIIRPEMLIAQFSFEWMSEPCRVPYQSGRNHYQNSQGVIDSRYDQVVHTSLPMP